MQAGPRFRAPFDLDTELLRFSKLDKWTIRDAVASVFIFGMIGSGKTSASGSLLARAYLANGFGGLVLCAKPEERALWERYAATTGRSSDLIIIGKDAKWRFNFLDYELRRKGEGAGQTENLVNLLTSIVEIAEGKITNASTDPFWDRAMRELLRNAIDLITIANGTITLEDITKLITDAPQSPQQAEDASWQANSYCWKLITQAAARPNKTTREAHDLDTAARYWHATYPRLAERVRTSIVANYTSVSDLLQHGLAWELFSTTTNIVPEVTYKNGAILVLDFPVQEYGEQGRIIQGIWKLMFQRAILRRNAVTDPRVVMLWADEAQNFVSNFDFQYQAVSRSARAATVYLSQSISNLYSVLKSRDETHALLGNFQTQVFHANNDFQTNQYAADMIAMERATSYGFSANNHDTNEPGSTGSRGVTGSETVRYKVMPAAFTTLLKGGTTKQAEAIVFQGGRTFAATNDTYLKVVFSQF